MINLKLGQSKIYADGRPDLKVRKLIKKLITIRRNSEFFRQYGANYEAEYYTSGDKSKANIDKLKKAGFKTKDENHDTHRGGDGENVHDLTTKLEKGKSKATIIVRADRSGAGTRIRLSINPKDFKDIMEKL